LELFSEDPGISFGAVLSRSWNILWSCSQQILEYPLKLFSEDGSNNMEGQTLYNTAEEL
jgi:hypothetical protein